MYIQQASHELSNPMPGYNVPRVVVEQVSISEHELGKRKLHDDLELDERRLSLDERDIQLQKQHLENDKRRIENDKRRIENDMRRIENDKRRIANDKRRIENDKRRIENQIHAVLDSMEAMTELNPSWKSDDLMFSEFKVALTNGIVTQQLCEEGKAVEK